MINQNQNIQQQENTKTINKNMITVLYALKSKQTTEITPAQLFKELKEQYSLKYKEGRVCYEYFDTDKQEYKPHIDYEEYVNESSESICREKEKVLMNVLCEIFGTTKDDWALASDSRKCEKKNKFKISFHCVLITKKMAVKTMSHLKWFINQNEHKFVKEGLIIPDIKIYREGWNKYRVPMAKKSQEDKDSMMVPLNYNRTPKDYAKHLVSYVEDIDEYFVIDVPADYESTHKKYRAAYLEHEQYNAEEAQDIINSYTCISTKKQDDTLLVDIEEKICGRNHKNNHNYLVFDEINMTLVAKCHSKQCEKFRRILYRPAAPTEHFDEDYMHNIPIPDGEEDNYKQVKQYFEHFFIKIRDTDSYYRINKMYSDKYNYNEKDLVSIKIEGYASDLYYKVLDADNQIKQENFYKRYKTDQYKSSYQNLVFAPYNNENLGKIDNKKYNLFEGFNYARVLSYKERKSIEEEKYQDLDFLLNHIRKYACDDNEKHFDFMMQWFANIIQDPTNIPQIILGFYSKQHGTGKSNLTKFLASVLGHDLSYFGTFDQIMDPHTHAHVGKLFNIIEEVSRHSTKSRNTTIKDFSQREVAIYNEKNKPQQKIRCYVRYIMTTNDADGIYFDSEDRRYALYTFQKIDRDANDENRKYIKKLERVLEDKHIIYLFGKYLEQYDITYKKTSEWIENRVLTEDYYTMMSEDNITSFLKEFLTLEGDLGLEELENYEYMINDEDDTIMIKKDTFYKKYKEYTTENSFGKAKGKNNFYKAVMMAYKECFMVSKKCGKQYFKVDLQKMWRQFYGEKVQFINNHIGDEEEYKQRQEERKLKQQRDEEILKNAGVNPGELEL